MEIAKSIRLRQLKRDSSPQARLRIGVYPRILYEVIDVMTQRFLGWYVALRRQSPAAELPHSWSAASCSIAL